MSAYWPTSPNEFSGVVTHSDLPLGACGSARDRAYAGRAVGSVWLHALSAVEGFTNDVGMPRVARRLLDQVQQHPAQVLINKVVTGTPIIEWHLGCDLLGYRNLVGVSTQPMGDSVVVVDDEVLGRIRLDVRPLASPGDDDLKPAPFP